MKIIKSVAAVLICAAMLVGCNNIEFNNTASRFDLITEYYSEEQIDSLIDTMCYHRITLSEFKKDFAVQCVRQTFQQGYYVVLLLEDGGSAFVFFTQENRIYSIVKAKNFMSKSEFLAQDVTQMTRSEVRLFDPAGILLPASAVDMTAHIVQEGFFVVKYLRYLDGVFLDDPIVSSVEFYENSDILTSTDVNLKNAIPYILEIDRK